jgi:hypothetical protein
MTVSDQKIGERTRLARDARHALGLYVYFLTRDGREGLTEEEVLARQKLCLGDARQALDDLAELHEEVVA